jgi:AraC-like DNA-binding protein
MAEPSVVAWLPTLDAALRGALLALLGLLGLSQLRLAAPREPAERLGLALAAGLCVQVVVQSPSFEAGPPALWRAPLVGVAMGNSALFWLFARSLCDDDFRPTARHLAVWAAVVAAGTLNLAWLGPWCWSGAAPAWASWLSQAVFGLPLLFGLLGVGAAAQHWRDDLVEQRRWLRAFIVVGGSLYTLGMVLARRTTADGRLTPPLAAVDAAALLVFVAATAWLLLRPVRTGGPEAPGAGLAPAGRPATAPEAAVPVAPAAFDDAPAADVPANDPPDPPTPAFAAEDEALAAALDRAMRVEHAYRDPELSVAGLAARLRVPEYRLRRLINQRLGHRNFSAFLNGHRLAEAREALADPARAHLPVLTLALEAGFGSIGPFNRAFKAATGLTPTDFRRAHLADS